MIHFPHFVDINIDDHLPWEHPAALSVEPEPAFDGEAWLEALPDEEDLDYLSKLVELKSIKPVAEHSIRDEGDEDNARPH